MKKYGKFDTLQALLSAYASLEAEFTKRCQTVAELAKRVDELTALLEAKAEENPRKTNAEQDAAYREAIIKDYLTSLTRGADVVVMPPSGAVPLAPIKKPHNLKEAKELADYVIRRS